MLSISDLYLTYSFIRRLTSPFEEWDAFRRGVIDADGNILIAKADRTPNQKDSLKNYDIMLLNLKKILSKIPGGSSKFATYAAALYLIKEPKPLAENFESYITNLSQDDMQQINELLEDAPVNNMGDGAIATNDEIMGHKVFDVDSDVLWKSRMTKHPKHRYSKYVNDDETGQQIKEYGKKNPKKGILLRNSKTGEMVFLRRKLKPINERTTTDALSDANDDNRLNGVKNNISHLINLDSDDFHETRMRKVLQKHFDAHHKKSIINNKKEIIRGRY